MLKKTLFVLKKSPCFVWIEAIPTSMVWKIYPNHEDAWVQTVKHTNPLPEELLLLMEVIAQREVEVKVIPLI